MCPLGRQPNTPAGGIKKVSDLLMEGGTVWDEAKLNQYMYEFDVSDIKKIAIGGPTKSDCAAWNYTKSGAFSVKSAYHLQMQYMKAKNGNVGGSTTVAAHKGWLNLWNANVPGKIKVHVWRLLKNGLALGAELQRRRIKGGVVCVACGREETALHRFWHCPHAQQVWSHLQSFSVPGALIPPVNIHNHKDMVNWMLEWLASVKDSEMDITLMVLYQTWMARNEARDGKKIEDPEIIARRAVHLLEEWHNVQTPKAVKPPVAKECWLPPSEGWTKVNTDGAWSKSTEKGGGGVVVRDHDGRFLGGASHFFPSLMDPEEAELQACKHAMELVRRLS
jgi:hypothetical protein